jgi:outer membrane protein OmpA-like peptidoglycan-associated protein/flagellar hook assembly protein FlgD
MSKIKLYGIAVLLMLAGYDIFAQHLEELYSPYYLSFGPQTVSGEVPIGDIYNPSSSALIQRVTLDLNYITLLGLGEDDGLGHALNAGISIPSSFGVASFSGHIITTPFTDINLGTVGSINASFSKDLYPNFLVGIGVSGIYGSQDGNQDWGLGVDVGITHMLGDIYFFKDVTWGFAFRGLGKGYEPTSDTRFFPRAFTPAVALSFKPIKDDSFVWTFATDLSFPGFAEARISFGNEFEIADLFIVRAAFIVGWDDFSDPEERLLIAGGLSLNFKIDIQEDIEILEFTERGWNKSDIKANFAYAPMQSGVHALGAGVNLALGVLDKDPPDIKVKAPDVLYMSPNLDGVKDDMLLPIGISDQRHIKGYRLVIEDSRGRVVREIENKDERPENIDLQTIVDRLLYIKSGITIPPALRWDGRSEKSALLPDGTYTYYIEAWDDNNNRASTPKRKIVIDNTKPQADLKTPYLIFSPNEDGNKDVLKVELAGSKEELWKAVIKDSEGKVVLRKEWKESAPLDFNWDGKDDNGKLSKDGVYSIELASTDRAGNSSSSTLTNIIINTQPTPVFITTDADGFSPNADGYLDTMRFKLFVGEKTGIKTWAFELLHEKKGRQHVFAGESSVDEYIIWDGTGEGGVAPDGIYYAVLTVEYENGNKPVEKSRTFRLDTSPPYIELNLNPAPFSPDNDGVEDELFIKSKIEDLSPIAQWHLKIADPKGKHFTSFSGIGMPSSEIIWDGLSDEGELVQAAEDYPLQLTVVDDLGNKAAADKVIPIDVLVLRDGDRLKIRIPSITFAPNTADYENVAPEAYEKNMWTIKRLAKIFNRYKKYNILIEGHAVHVFWQDPEKAKAEQQNILLPLSKKRAEAIKKALVKNGIEAKRISTAGKGGAEPIVPFSDQENVWKNRRVEFILIREEE